MRRVFLASTVAVAVSFVAAIPAWAQQKTRLVVYTALENEQLQPLKQAAEAALKDIEIACAFARRDGSHLTDRRRVIADTVGMKSRKTYTGVLIGFVNVNANKAKCSPVTASRT